MSRKDADIRLHTGWLAERWFTRMIETPEVLAAFALGLMVSMKNDLDGRLSPRLLSQITPNGERSLEIESALIATRQAVRAPDGGLQFIEWSTKATSGGLGQSTAASIEEGRARNRENQREVRRRKAAEREGTSEQTFNASLDTSPVTDEGVQAAAPAHSEKTSPVTQTGMFSPETPYSRTDSRRYSEAVLGDVGQRPITGEIAVTKNETDEAPLRGSPLEPLPPGSPAAVAAVRHAGLAGEPVARAKPDERRAQAEASGAAMFERYSLSPEEIEAQRARGLADGQGTRR